MGLQVVFGETLDRNNQYKSLGDSWRVCLDHAENEFGNGVVVMHGFARRADAEIAARVLPKTGIDFDADLREIRRQREAFGGEEAVKKFVCEHLQW